ncbi:MAG: membrane protein insertion efficiency factor YidD [Acidimicrobiales bacterium]
MTNSTTTSSKPSNAPGSSEPTRVARALLALIGGYQRLHAGRVAPCRFYPSCSEYAREAVAEHGARRGTALALRRLVRCRPFGPHGVDLVPLATERRSA